MMLSNIAPRSPERFAEIDGDGDMIITRKPSHVIRGCKLLKIYGFLSVDISGGILSKAHAVLKIARYVFGIG